MIASLDLKRKQRFDFMSCLYNRTDGLENGLIELESIADEIGMSEGEASIIAQYLAKEGLIQLRLQHIVSITHGGIVEVEAAFRRPDTSTEHFPPIHILAQNGSTRTTPAGEGLKATDVAMLRLFLSALELQIAKLHLNAEEAVAFHADIMAARTQISSSRPKRQVVVLCLESLLAVVDRAGTSALTTDLQAKLPALRAFLRQ
jgi:hypothetical protein